MTDGLDCLPVADAIQQPVLPVAAPTDVIDDLRLARTADGLNDDGSPYIAPERGYVTNAEERARLLGYLAEGATVFEDLVRGPDIMDPTHRLAVPATFRTDGMWVWPGSVEYYLRWHSVAPEPELRRRIAASGYRCPPVDPAVVARVRAAIDDRGRLIQRNVDAYVAAHPKVRPDRPDRFPKDVNDALVTLGWRRGRDLGPKVDRWLAPRVTEKPFPAALAVMREFGGLRSLANRPGKDSAQTPFTIYPAPRDQLAAFAPDVQALRERLGTAVFQVGVVEHGLRAIVVDDSGRVFLVGPMELYAGASFDEALVRMSQGIRCEELPEIGL